MSFEVAVQLLKCGFCNGSNYYYDLRIKDLVKNISKNGNQTVYINWLCDYLIEAPIQSLSQKWFREIHELHVHADCNASGWYWLIDKTNGTGMKNSGFDGPNNGGCWNSYEAALEVGLLEACKILEYKKSSRT